MTPPLDDPAGRARDREAHADAPVETPSARPRVPGALWALLGAIVILDQATKALVRAYVPLHDVIPVVPGVLNLTHILNTGAAFGFLNTAEFPYKSVVIALFAAAALTGIGVYASHLAPHERLLRFGLILVLAGAAGNLIDRVTAGAVVDFVDVVIGGWHFWAFNVADSAITLGVVAMLLDMFGLGRHVSTTS